MRSALLLLIVLLLTAPVGAQLQVQDTTHRYDREVQALGAAVSHFGRPVRLYISDDPPADVDAFSHYRFRDWKLARNALLICVFPGPRKVAMTAGPDLEARGLDGAYIRTTVIPHHFKPGWARGGLTGAVEASLQAASSRIASTAASSSTAHETAIPTSASPPQGSYLSPNGSPSPASRLSSGLPNAFGLVAGVMTFCFFAWIVSRIDRAGQAGPAGRVRGAKGRWRPRGIGRFTTGFHTPSSHTVHDTSSAPMVDTSSSSVSVDSGSVDAGGSGFSDTGSGSF